MSDVDARFDLAVLYERGGANDIPSLAAPGAQLILSLDQRGRYGFAGAPVPASGTGPYSFAAGAPGWIQK